MSGEDRRSGDNAVRQDIGRLEGKIEMMIQLQQSANAEQKSQRDAIAEMKSDQKTMQADISSMKPHVEDYKQNKQRGIGFVAGITLLSGSVGGMLVKLFSSPAAADVVQNIKQLSE